MNITTVPWILAAVTALWFGWAGWRTGRNWVACALGGAVFGLVTATIVFGLGHSVAFPFCVQDVVKEHARWTVESILVILILGWPMSMNLRRNPPGAVNQPPNAST